MTKVRVTYVAISQDNEPIASASTFKDLKEAIDIYYGVGKEAAKCDGWFPHDVKYPDIYEGHYKYSWSYIVGDMIDEGVDKVDVYCIDFYPHTVYDIKQAQTIRENGIVELSDEEIKEWIDSTPYYGHCTTEYKEGLDDGIKWYREQLKLKS